MSVSWRVDDAINSVTAQLRHMAEMSGTHTVQNTLCPYDRAGWVLDLASSQTRLLRVTHPDADMRQAATQAEQRLEQLKSSLRLNRGVFLALRTLDLSKEDASTQWYVKRELRAYQLAGVDRDETTRQRITTMQAELVRMGQQFKKISLLAAHRLLSKTEKASTACRRISSERIQLGRMDQFS